MLTLTKRKLALAVVALAAIGLAWWGAGIALSQDNTVPGCPAGVPCVALHEWPPFTAIFETTSRHGVTYNGTDYDPRVTVELEWHAMDDWKATIIDAERIDIGGSLIFDLTGAWEEQDGRTHRKYSPMDRSGEVVTRTLEDDVFSVPPGGFYPVWYSGHDIGTRTDGSTRSVTADLCAGTGCNEVVEGATGQSTTMGRTFSDEELDDTVFTDGYGRIPLIRNRPGGEGDPYMKVMELQIQPVEPDSDACQTNMRTLFFQEGSAEQEFASDCPSENRSGAFAHYYTFTVDETQMVTVQATAPDDDLYIYLLDGMSKSSPVLDENDNAPQMEMEGASGLTEGVQPGQSSLISRELSPGTYTIEVTTNTAEHSDGTFAIGVSGQQDAPITAYR